MRLLRGLMFPAGPLWSRRIAVLVITAALLAVVAGQTVLDPYLSDSVRFATFYGAVAVGVFIGGYRTAAIVAVLAYALSHYLLLESRGVFDLSSVGAVAGLLGYVSTCTAIALIGQSIHSAKERAAASGELLKVAFASIAEAVVTTDARLKVTHLNPAAESMTGWRLSEARGRVLAEVVQIVDETTGRSVPDLACTLSCGELVRKGADKLLLMNRDGTRRPVGANMSVLNDGGRSSGHVLVIRDVSEHRARAEAEERERRLLTEAAAANAKFRALFDQSALFAGIVALDGTLLETNRTSWEGLGFEGDRFLGKPFWEGPWWNRSPALIEQLRAAYHQALAGHAFRAELPYFAPDGSERVTDVTISPIKDDEGRVIFLAPTGTDVTDRKRAEEERQKFVTLVENSTDFIGMSDLNLVPFYVNPAGLSLVGLKNMDELRHTRVQDFFLPEDWPRIGGEFLPSVLEKGRGETEVRFRNFQTGETRWMMFKVVTLNDASGRPNGFATVSQDVTERRRLEENLRALASDLSEANRRKSVFLATLAHELRNPLAPMRNMLEILKRAGSNPQMVDRSVETMQRQLTYLVRLVDDLMDMNRITHDRLELRMDQVDLSDVIRQAVHTCRPIADAAHHTLQLKLPVGAMLLEADHARLCQVFGNLLSNSCKYTPPGGHITISAERHAQQFVVAVEDDGIGIPCNRLHSIFEMFEQIDSSIGRSQGGLGIGLALVKRLVELHGGTVEAHSTGVGAGSRFEVRLPAKVEVLHIGDAEQSQPQSSIAPHRFLVVDDNVDAATSLAMLLQMDGHEVRTAHDGIEALETSNQYRPEILLLDIGLPELNGYDVCSRLRMDPANMDLIIVAMTGWGQDEDRSRSAQAGFDGHLVKPVDYSMLLALLGSLLEQRALTAPLVRRTAAQISVYSP